MGTLVKRLFTSKEHMNESSPTSPYSCKVLMNSNESLIKWKNTAAAQAGEPPSTNEPSRVEHFLPLTKSDGAGWDSAYVL